VSVRRGRRLPVSELDPYLLPLPEPPAPLDWATVFGNHHPVELEVGFGKGLFLLTSALVRPDVNFVGVEIVRKYQLFTATRLAKRGVGNVRLTCADARGFLRDRVGTGSLRAVHIYFPDPWWKKRHHKRRVFTPEFGAECERVLARGGRLHLATDVAEYFGLMHEALVPRAGLRPLSADEPAADAAWQTNFERKARERGEAVYRAVYERESSEHRA
jgi:tRNA (guanine-N7-)-methyltransferase